MPDGTPIPKRVTLYPWNTVAVRLKNEASWMEASIYQVLDEWGIYGWRRTQLKRMVCAVQEGIAEFEKDKRAQRESKPPPKDPNQKGR